MSLNINGNKNINKIIYVDRNKNKKCLPVMTYQDFYGASSEYFRAKIKLTINIHFIPKQLEFPYGRIFIPFNWTKPPHIEESFYSYDIINGMCTIETYIEYDGDNWGDLNVYEPSISLGNSVNEGYTTSHDVQIINYRLTKINATSEEYESYVLDVYTNVDSTNEYPYDPDNPWGDETTYTEIDIRISDNSIYSDFDYISYEIDGYEGSNVVEVPNTYNLVISGYCSVNGGRTIYVETNTGKVYSKRVSFGDFSTVFENIPFVEGTIIYIS